MSDFVQVRWDSLKVRVECLKHVSAILKVLSAIPKDHSDIPKELLDIRLLTSHEVSSHDGLAINIEQQPHDHQLCAAVAAILARKS
jgi:hypothetical protein